MPQAQDIVENLRQRDHETFELVFRTYYPELCRFANKYLQSEAESEELVQDLFVYLWKKLDSLVIQTSLKSYLYSAVRNRAFNVLKHQKVMQEHVAYQTIHSNTEYEHTAMEVKDLESRINQSIESLPERCREVFRLSRQEGLKYAEIAEQLGISVKTVEAQMGKALKKLREDLKNYLPLFLLVWLEYLK